VAIALEVGGSRSCRPNCTLVCSKKLISFGSIDILAVSFAIASSRFMLAGSGYFVLNASTSLIEPVARCLMDTMMMIGNNNKREGEEMTT
jgi:hypothetical protein